VRRRRAGAASRARIDREIPAGEEERETRGRGGGPPVRRGWGGGEVGPPTQRTSPGRPHVTRRFCPPREGRTVTSYPRGGSTDTVLPSSGPVLPAGARPPGASAQLCTPRREKRKATGGERKRGGREEEREEGMCTAVQR
jgi:hypothetical protein